MSIEGIIRKMEGLAVRCGSRIDKVGKEDICKMDMGTLEGGVEKMEREYSGKNAAEVIRKIMGDENVTQKELAIRMGCGRQNVSQMLSRGTVNMRYDSFCRMAEALGYEITLRKK